MESNFKMNKDETNKQQSSEETKVLETEATAAKISESEDKNKKSSEEAEQQESHETPIAEVKSKEDNNKKENVASTKDEEAKEAAESDTNLKTDTKIKQKFEILNKKENEENNKSKEISCNDNDEEDKENIESKSKDEKEEVAKGEDKETKDSKEDKEMVDVKDSKDGKEIVKCKADKSKDDKDKNSTETEQSNEKESTINNCTSRATKRKRSISSKSDGEEDKEDNKEIETKETETAASEINEDIDDDGEFEDVEAPEGEEELIVPDETGNGEDEENEEEDDGNDEQFKVIKASADEDELKLPKSSEGEESNFSAIEPELVAIEDNTKDSNTQEEEQSANDDETSNNGANDPLNCLENQEDGEEVGAESNAGSCAESNQGVGCDSNQDGESILGGDSNEGGGISNQGGEDSNETNPNKEAAAADDDDEVQFIETRNSPICIESDDEEEDPNTNTNSNSNSNTTPVSNKRETRSSLSAKNTSSETDKQTINLPSTTITVPKNLTVTRTSARKSTSRPQYNASPPTTVPQQQQHNKPKNFQYLQKATTYRRSMPAAVTPRHVVDTIEVLDSSDEEGSGSAAATRNKSFPHTFKTPPKRTLMAAKNCNKKSPNKMVMGGAGGSSGGFASGMPNNFAPQIRRQPKKPAPPPLPPPTPQSNFLNAVQLQPATSDGNPPAFSALLSNKSVIIPNAFYGNPMRGADVEMEKRYARWLDNFITQFSNPQLVASHSCFVFLQRALKYKDFVRIKNIRTSLNIHAQMAKEQVNHQLMLDLRAIFLKNYKEITTHGRRFCELTCSMVENKSVTLLVHGITSRVIMKTCNMEMPSSSSAASSSATSANNTQSSSSASSTSRKRQLEEDEDEYVPGKNKIKTNSAASVALENVDHSSGDGDGGAGGPKRSLRSKRTKRIDNNFSYNEDDLAEYDLEDEEEQAERLAREEIQRKIDHKRLEAQRQRQRQAESFESAFLETFAKGLDGRVPTSLPPARTATNQRARVSNSLSASSVAQHALHNDAEDLLTATWIENVENEDAQIISDDDEPREHRIYKQQQQQQQQQQKYQRQQQQQQMQKSSNKSSNLRHHQGHDLDPRHWPKNTDINLYVTSKNKDICVICKLSVQRIVHHYVNEHRGSEVYNSRLNSFQLDHLRRGACNVINISIYKNGQPQYEAHCIFCQKQSRFMLPYWFQHFTMHTGEYAYRCSGCGVRKPTRSLLTQHQSQGCPKGGSVLQDYSHDVKKIRVDARICTLCNYVQLHRNNIVKHLHQQHNIKQILPKHIQTIVLLKEQQSTSGPSMPAAEIANTRRKPTLPRSASQARKASYVVDDDDDDTLLFAEDALPPIPQQYQQQQQQAPSPYQQEEAVESTQNQYYNYMPPYMMNQANQPNFAWEDNDPSDDLSFMICGMLDVQMNNTTSKK